MFDKVIHRVISSVSDTDIAKANLLQKATTAGICVDKAAMLRNELPSIINVHVLIDVLEALRQREQPYKHLPPALPPLES